MSVSGFVALGVTLVRLIVSAIILPLRLYARRKQGGLHCTNDRLAVPSVC